MLSENKYERVIAEEGDTQSVAAHFGGVVGLF
jgi:hypothetical protein